MPDSSIGCDLFYVMVGAALFVTAWGDVAATIMLSLLPTLAFAFLVQRYLIQGLTLGAVRQ